MPPKRGKGELKGVILHGGHGTRLRPLTHTGPKQLIPIANKPISQYVLESLRGAGCREIAIILGDIFPEKVKEYYGDGSKFGVKITYVQQEQPKGIAHAVGLCEEFVGDSAFVVHLGDDLLKDGAGNFAGRFLNSDFDAMVLLQAVKRPELFGVAEFDGNGGLKRLVEKPKNPPSHYALTGVYFFTKTVFESIHNLRPSGRGELEITEAIQNLLDRGLKVGHEIVTGWWKDTGSPGDILEANRLVLDELKGDLQGKIEGEASVQGRVILPRNAVVRGRATVRGPVVIGDGSVIEGEAYVGPYTSLGREVTVRRGEIQNSIVMDSCVIDVDDSMTDCIIGAHSIVSGNSETKPRGKRLIVGERSTIKL